MKKLSKLAGSFMPQKASWSLEYSAINPISKTQEIEEKCKTFDTIYYTKSIRPKKLNSQSLRLTLKHLIFFH